MSVAGSMGTPDVPEPSRSLKRALTRSAHSNLGERVCNVGRARTRGLFRTGSRVYRLADPSVGKTGRADVVAPSRVHRAAAAGQPGGAGCVPGLCLLAWCAERPR